ncbi:hypothetical protein PC116_g32562 [Phytophthora cactorum]|nr:hypothetical protein PC116_g32562 [Phytophthora cactorum]
MVVFAVAVVRGLSGLGVHVFQATTIVRVVLVVAVVLLGVVVVLVRVVSVVLVGAELATRSHSRRSAGIGCLQDGGSDAQGQHGKDTGVHLGGLVGQSEVNWLGLVVGCWAGGKMRRERVRNGRSDRAVATSVIATTCH